MPHKAAGILAYTEDNEVLLVKEERAGRVNWGFPGGRIEKGETPLETALREFHEETAHIFEKKDLEIQADVIYYDCGYYLFIMRVPFLIDISYRFRKNVNVNEHVQSIRYWKLENAPLSAFGKALLTDEFKQVYDKLLQ